MTKPTKQAPQAASPGLNAERLDALSTAVFELDSRLGIRYLNAAAEQLLGTSADKLVGKALLDMVTLPPATEALLHETVGGSHAYRERQIRLQGADLETHLIDLCINPVQNDDASDGLLIECIQFDRAQRIARESAQQQRQFEIQSLLRGLAHEIRNPLSGLKGAAQLLDQALEDESLKEYTDIIRSESDRLSTLLERLTGPVDALKERQVNLHEAMEHVRQLLRAGTPASIAIARDYDPSIPECHTDHDRLIQVLLNIATNAVNALSDMGGTITFRSRVVTNHTIANKRHSLVACLSIEDNGPGIPAEQHEHVFLPMVTNSPKGSGLGLSIAQALTVQLGGVIHLTSPVLTNGHEQARRGDDDSPPQPDSSRPGALFSVYLPLDGSKELKA